jgi:hypothetical protein
MDWYKKVAEVAPEWSWGHFTRAFLILGRTWTMFNEKLGEKGAQIVAELNKAIATNHTVQQFYTTTISFQKMIGHLDDAIVTAEKMSQQPELHAAGLAELWRLRLDQAKGSEPAKESLKAELAKLAKDARDLQLLVAIRQAYATLLQDLASADALERQIHQLDPLWYPERGRTLMFILSTAAGCLMPCWPPIVSMRSMPRRGRLRPRTSLTGAKKRANMKACFLWGRIPR